MEVKANNHRNIVCMYARGPKFAHYLGIDDHGELTTMRMVNSEFDAEFCVAIDKTPMQFAQAYTRNESARKMVPLSGSAIRVLNGILTGQSEPADATPQPETEKQMSESTFRKPDGPVAQVHAYLDKRLDAIKAGTISRKELIEGIVASKGINEATATTQAGRWARERGITFSRPIQAAEAKTAKRKAAAKKAAKAKAPKAAPKAKAPRKPRVAKAPEAAAAAA